MNWLVCLTDTEWRNWCARGLLRLAHARIVRWDNTEPLAAHARLFAMAPQTKLEASDALLIAELTNDWSERARSHVCAREGDLRELGLEVVKSFYPVAEKDRSYYEELASRSGVRLGGAQFEEAWRDWIVEEGVRAADRSGRALIAITAVAAKADKRDDEYSWEELARLVLRPSTEIRKPPGLLEVFLRSRDKLIDLARGDHDSQAHIIAAAVEWVLMHRGEEVLAGSGELYAALEDLHAEVRNLGWDESIGISDSLLRGLGDLRALAPNSFNIELTPLSVSIFLRYFERARGGGFDITYFLRDLAQLERLDGPDAARLVAYMIGVEFGPEKVRQIGLHKGASAES